jgi:hypothetical protein
MHEHIRAALIRLNKSKTFLRIEPLYCSGSHREPFFPNHIRATDRGHLSSISNNISMAAFVANMGCGKLNPRRIASGAGADTARRGLWQVGRSGDLQSSCRLLSVTDATPPIASGLRQEARVMTSACCRRSLAHANACGARDRAMAAQRALAFCAPGLESYPFKQRSCYRSPETPLPRTLMPSIAKTTIRITLLLRSMKLLRRSIRAFVF